MWKNCWFFSSFLTFFPQGFQLHVISLKHLHLREFRHLMEVPWAFSCVPLGLLPHKFLHNKLSGSLNAWHCVCIQKLPKVSLLEKAKGNKCTWLIFGRLSWDYITSKNHPITKPLLFCPLYEYLSLQRTLQRLWGKWLLCWGTCGCWGMAIKSNLVRVCTSCGLFNIIKAFELTSIKSIQISITINELWCRFYII